MQAEYGILLTLPDQGIALMITERDGMELLATLSETIAARRGDFSTHNGEIRLEKGDDGSVVVTVKRRLEGSII